MILLNVLMVVAVAAAAATVMIVAQDMEVRRSIRLHDAAQARAYARAGELSAVVALRRDALTAPEVDHPGEAWNTIGQNAIAVPGGTFALSITDEQAKFNVNALAQGDPIPTAAFLAIGAASNVPRPTLEQIVATLVLLGPISDETPLRALGIPTRELEALATRVTYLPPEARLNVNTTDPGLLSLVLSDNATVRRLVEARGRAALTEEDAGSLGAGSWLGVRSDHFRVETQVRMGEVTRGTSSLIRRALTPTGPSVAVVQRRQVRVGGTDDA